MARIIYRGVQQTKDTCSGKARIKGRRVTVSLIIGELLRGETREKIRENYQINDDDINACLGYAKKCVDHFDSRLPESD